MDSAKKYFDNGKYADAVILYKKAIQKDPKSGEAYYHLALAEIKLGKLVEAYQALSAASVNAAGDEKIQSVFADFCFELYLLDRNHPKGFYDKVANVSAQLLEKNRNSYDGLRLKGYLAMADRKPDEAIQALRQADGLRPMQPQVVLPLAKALIENNQAAEGERLALAFIQKDKTFGPMYDVLVNLYTNTGRAQDAENILKTKADNNPKQAAYVLNLAGYYWSAKRPDDAKRTLQRLIDNPKNYPHPHALAGDFYLAAREMNEALDQYNQGLKSDPQDQVLYQKKIVNALLLAGKRDDAQKLVEELAKTHSKDDDVQLVRATLWIEGRKPQEVDAAINLLKPLVEKKPEDANRHYRLGQAYQIRGRTQEAQAEWSASAKADPAFPQPRIALAELDLQTGRFQAALDYCKQILTRDPKNQGAKFLSALALANLSRQDEARLVLNELLKEAPNSSMAKLALGRLDLMQNHLPEAEKEFAELYKAGQSDLRPLDGLLTTYLAEKEPKKAMDLLEKELKLSPDNPELVARHAEVNARAGNYTAALAEYRSLLAKDPNSPRLNLRMGEMALMAQDNGAALQSFQKAVQLDPKNMRALEELGGLETTMGKKQEALDTYRKALALNPDQPGLLNNVAYLMADVGGDPKAAMDLARKGLEKARNDPHLNDTIGFIYLKEHLNDSAVQTFRAVVQKAPNVSTYHLHLANALLNKGDKQEARTELQAALMLNPPKDEEGEIRSLLSRIGQ